MRNIGALMDGVYDAMQLAGDGGPFHPIRGDDRWYTFCNEAFNLIALRMGYDRFERKTAQRPFGAITANQMFDEMMRVDGDWRRVTSAVGAQDLANLGALVVAAYKNETGHGHVAVVIPGIAQPSASWGSPAPKLFNVGKDVFLGKKASFAFQKDEMPTFFTLKEVA